MGIPPKTLPLASTSKGVLRTSARVLFLSLDGAQPMAGATRHSLMTVDQVHIGRGEERKWQRRTVAGQNILHLTVPDSWMSTQHARLQIGEEVSVEDVGSSNGTKINGTSIDGPRILHAGDWIELGCTFLCYLEIEHCDIHELMQQEASIHDGTTGGGMSTLLPELAHSMEQLKKIAQSKASVIVYGESGTGKELTARGIHDCSGRSGEFVAVNCAAIPDTLLESELFGHRKGAFSGAVSDRVGLVEASCQGTLFLDEIGELSVKGQASLLRVLQQQEVLPIGSNRPVQVDLRVVAATHRELLSAVAAGTFREDLYARLSTFIATVPPLRERRAELGAIVATILRQSGHAKNVCFAPAAARALLQYHWPRNIRELEKCLMAAVVLADGEQVQIAHLSDLVREGREVIPEKTGSRDIALRAQLIRLLKNHEGNVSRVGVEMGKKRQQIQKWCKRLDIDPKQYR